MEKAQIGDKALMADLVQAGDRVVVARGGKGGQGNTHFASSTNQTPMIAKSGEPGEENSIILEMRLIADVGIIGYPNVGKSTLLAAASAARPEIAGYPFTTRQPVLGTVEVNHQSFVMAEIPGLIEGAHMGRGLGHDFLRHVVRTKILIHLIDGSSEAPEEDMARVNAELGLYDTDLVKKPQIVAVNKIDLPEVRPRLVEIEDAFGRAGVPALFISAATGEGVPELMAETMKVLQSVPAVKKVDEGRVPKKVFRPQPQISGPTVRKEGETFVVGSAELERLIEGADIGSYEVRRQIKRQLTRMGASRALKRAGVKPGDRVRCGKLEWEW
jgi:GTP-binding protein